MKGKIRNRRNAGKVFRLEQDAAKRRMVAEVNDICYSSCIEVITLPGFENRYSLNKEQSAFLASKNTDEVVYCGMKMENRNISFPQTKTILDGVNVSGVTLDDIQAVLNMRDAWRYLLSYMDDPVALPFICKLNEFIARNEALEWGVLRTGRVGISGTQYEPPVPVSAEVEKELDELLTADMTNTEKAINAFLWGTRRQLFWDGNKRTSLLLANKLLVSGGNGMLTIVEKNMAQFNDLLVGYYNTGNMKEIKRFLYENAVSGIEFGTTEKKKKDYKER